MIDEEDETVVYLASGWELRSGSPNHDFTSGEYVRLVDPNGHEHYYWDHSEWEDDPILVMGAILNAAAETKQK